MSAPKREQQPFQWTKVPVPFSGGVDTRADRKLIQAPKLALLENAVFTTPETLRKRYGYDTLADLALDNIGGAFYDQPITDARMLFTRGKSLWLRSQESFYSLAEDRYRWQREAEIPNGKLVFGQRFTIDGVAAIQRSVRATVGSLTVFAHQTLVSTQNNIVIVCYDNEGTELSRMTVINASIPRMAIVSDVIMVFYVNMPTTTLYMLPFVPGQVLAPTPLLPSAGIVIASDIHTTATTYDVDSARNARALVAYNSTTALTVKIGYVAPSGAIVGAFTPISTTAAPSAVACAADPGSGCNFVTWMMATQLGCQTFQPDLTALSVLRTYGLGAVGPLTGGALTAIWRSENEIVSFWDFTIDPATTPGQYRKVQMAFLHSDAVAYSVGNLVVHGLIATKPWLRSGKIYIWTKRASRLNATTEPLPPTQRTAFLHAVPPIGMAPIIMGTAYENEVDTGYTTHPPRVDIVGDMAWATPTLLRSIAGIQSGGNVGVDFSYTPQSIECGQAAYVTGTALWYVDGANVVETGFWEYPEFPSPSSYISAAAGPIPGGVSYSYRVYYEWTSATGEFFQSTCSTDVSIALAAGNWTVTLKVPTLTHTLKTSVRISIYRTLANGTIFYFLQSGANAISVDFLSFTDQALDTDIKNNPVEYRSSVPQELSNLAPPAGTCIAIGNTRVFMAGFEDPNLILASKLRGFGEALNWNPAIAIELPDARQEGVTALATLGDALLAFRRKTIYNISGDGPDNTGLQGVFAPPRVVSDDAGAQSAASVVRTPLGLLFQTERGVYILGGDLGLGYAGADVEAYNHETITQTVSIPDRHEVRFTLASGKTLLFDYLAKQWAVFTIGGLHACVWKDRHVYLPDASGAAKAETFGQYLDDGVPYSWALETAWIHVGENQNHQRVRTVQILGEWIGDHASEMWVSYNYELGWSERIQYDVSAVINGEHYGDDVVYGGFVAGKDGNYGGNIGPLGLVSTSVYQVKIQPRRMRCQSIRFRWVETRRIDPAGVVTYPWMEGARLNEIALEIGLRGGLWRPGVDRTFGG